MQQILLPILLLQVMGGQNLIISGIVVAKKPYGTVHTQVYNRVRARALALASESPSVPRALVKLVYS